MEVERFGSFIAFIIITRLAGCRLLIQLRGMRAKLNG